MRLIRVCVLLVALAFSAGAFAVPAVLIVRLKPSKGMPPLDTPVCDFIANELQAGSRTIPIVWGLTDPIYRAAVQEGKIRSGNETPTLNEAFGVAAKLRAEYVLATDLRAGDGGVLSAAYLYRNGKLIWKDPDLDLGAAIAHYRDMLRKKQITQQQYDQSVQSAGYRTSTIQLSSRFGQDDTVRSLARTWVEMMNSGPFLGLAKQTEKATPAPGKGEAPVTPGTGTAPPLKPLDDARWRVDATSALKAGDSDKAVGLLRDAVDASPMDVSRRIFLIKTLMQVGQSEIAAREGRRAADLMPDHVEFRALAARGWIQAGNLDEAQADLKEAVARAPDSPDTRLLLAEVAIAKSDFPTAIDHLNKAITVGPSGD
ncbi:MAG: tetratricopeptide repeat protein, partial [Fimbriimonadales bacterium]